MAANQASRPWDSPGKNTGVGCHFLLQCMKMKSESEVAQSCPTLATQWTAAYQAPPSMGFSRQEYWSGVPLSSPKQYLLLLLHRFSRVRLCAIPETAAHQASRPWDSSGKNTGVGCHFLLQCMKVKSESEVAQSYLTLSNPMDCSLPGSSIRPGNLIPRHE